jgi:hypothetical protein
MGERPAIMAEVERQKDQFQASKRHLQARKILAMPFQRNKSLNGIIAYLTRRSEQNNVQDMRVITVAAKPVGVGRFGGFPGISAKGASA